MFFNSYTLLGSSFIPGSSFNFSLELGNNYGKFYTVHSVVCIYTDHNKIHLNMKLGIG